MVSLLRAFTGVVRLCEYFLLSRHEVVQKGLGCPAQFSDVHRSWYCLVQEIQQREDRLCADVMEVYYPLCRLSMSPREYRESVAT
jgi:hypothetical protein